MIVNQLKTIALLLILSCFFIGIGGMIGGQQGIQIAFIISLLINGLMYFFSDKMVLALYGAKPLDQNQYGWIYDIVRELAHSMHMPMPKLWLINTPVANAFATGRNPNNASVALTKSIIDLLEPHELRGVLAHELSHVKNRDILVATVAATLATAIGYLASMLRYAAFWGTFSNNNNKKEGNPLVMMLVAIIVPIAATLVQLAISRSREYLADETGSHCCHDPLALASALEKLHGHIPYAHMDQDDMRHASTASLFIVNPFNGQGFINLFSTHPPVQKRIERLYAIHEKMRTQTRK